MKRYRVLLFLVLLPLLLLNGCVYYNTLYNAKKLFKSAYSRPLVGDKASPQSIDEYTKAMKKCGYILTEYKNSKYCDQALFILAQCMYYKGNADLQTYEKCQEFLKFYPNSKLTPEVTLFKTSVLHDMKKDEEAISTLTEFLQNPLFKKYYPQAYIQLSIISMDNEAYAQAVYYLQKIIDNYPHSKEYKIAFFQLGYAYHLEKRYSQSNQVFQRLLKSRLEKSIKLDARYYIALNEYNLKNYKKVETEIKPLLKIENRLDIIPKIKLLMARNLLGLNQYTKAVALYNEIIKSNPRTQYSAEANYYLGEFYLQYEHDYEKSITFYNNVKIELPTSPFVDDAISKSAIASQIILYNKKDSKLAIADMVNQQLKLAEYYLHNMNLPDSALSVYRGIEKHRYEIKSELDSLQLKLSIMESDTIEVDTLHTVVSDSLLNESAKTDTSTVVKTQVPTNETKQVSSNQDSHQQKHEQHGSQKKESAIPVKTEGRDSTNTQVKSDSLNIPVHKAEPTHKELKARERQLLADLMEYDTEYAPLALFDQIWIYKYSLPDSMNMMAVYQHMQNEYPLNQYTHAAGMLIQGKEVVVTTDQEIENEEQYKQAMSIYSTSPDSAKTILKSLTELKGSPFGDKAKYSLGYIYWFNEHDSTDAKPYFDDLLKKDINSDYSKFIIQFYTGKNFVFTDLIPSFKALEEKEKRDRAEKILKEKMLKELNQPVTNPQPRDSLKTYSLPVKHDNPDTLKREVPTVEDQVKQDLLNKEQEIVKDVVNLPQPFDQYRPYDLYKPFIIKTQ